MQKSEQRLSITFFNSLDIGEGRRWLRGKPHVFINIALTLSDWHPECDIPQTQREGLSCQDLRDFLPVEMKERVLVPPYTELNDFDARGGQLQCSLYSVRHEPLFYLRIVRLEPEMAEMEGLQIRRTNQVDFAKVPEEKEVKNTFSLEKTKIERRKRRHAL